MSPGSAVAGHSAEDPLVAAVEALRVDSDHIFRQASARFEDGQYAEAITRFRTALARNPNLAMAHYNIGLALQQPGRHGEAAPEYEQFLKHQPGSPDAMNNLGLCAQAQGNAEAAAAWFEKAIALSPTYVKARLNRARLWLETKREPDAARDLVEVLRLEPHNGKAIEFLLVDEATRAADGRHRKIAQFLLGQKLPAAAAEVLRAGMLASPQDWKTAVALAWLLATTSDDAVRAPGDAVKLVEPLVKAGTAADATALDTLAAAYAAARHDEAVATANAALAKTTNDKQAEAIRRRLESYRERRAWREE